MTAALRLFLEPGSAHEGLEGVRRGTFPRVLGAYVREQRLLGWEEAIRKMTWMPAAKGFRQKACKRQAAASFPVISMPSSYRTPT